MVCACSFSTVHGEKVEFSGLLVSHSSQFGALWPMSNPVSIELLAGPEDDTQFFSAFHMHVHASSYVPIHTGTTTHIIKGVFLYTEFVHMHIKIDDNAFLHPLPLSPSEPSPLFPSLSSSVSTSSLSLPTSIPFFLLQVVYITKINSQAPHS